MQIVESNQVILNPAMRSGDEVGVKSKFYEEIASLNPHFWVVFGLCRLPGSPEQREGQWERPGQTGTSMGWSGLQDWCLHQNFVVFNHGRDFVTQGMLGPDGMGKTCLWM